MLLNQINPDLSTRGLQTQDLLTRAEMVLDNAQLLGCKKYVTAKTICQGNTKLNFAFVANLFNEWPALEKLSEVEKGVIDDWLFGSEGDREARGIPKKIINTKLSVLVVVE